MITISIVSHRQAALVADLMDDLARIASPLIDSIVLTRNVAEKFAPFPTALAHTVQVVENRAPKGFGANHNTAFSRCRSPVFAILNPDIRLPHDPFPRLVDALGELNVAIGNPVDRTAPALVAPMIVSSAGAREDSARTLVTPIEVIRRRAFGMRDRAMRPDWLAGMFLVIRSDAFKSVGGFDSRYFMYCEDFDLCARLRLNGWSLAVVEDATAVHAAQRASHRSLRHLLWHLSSLLKMWSSSAFWRYRRLLMAQRR